MLVAMLARRIRGANSQVVLREEADDGTLHNVNVWVRLEAPEAPGAPASVAMAFEPTPDELKALCEGASIVIVTSSGSKPSFRVYIEAPGEAP